MEKDAEAVGIYPSHVVADWLEGDILYPFLKIQGSHSKQGLWEQPSYPKPYPKEARIDSTFYTAGQFSSLWITCAQNNTKTICLIWILPYALEIKLFHSKIIQCKLASYGSNPV